MNRLAFVLLSLFVTVSSTAAFAGTGDPAPLCPKGAPRNCVVPNWGQINPGETDNAAASVPSLAAASPAPTSRMAVHMMPAAVTAQPAVGAVTSVVSPLNLFPKETAALLSVLQRARFDADGTITTGQEAIRRAAAAAAQRAGSKYTLTLYIKVPQTLKPDEAGLLGKKVDAINAALGSAPDGGPTATPKS